MDTILALLAPVLTFLAQIPTIGPVVVILVKIALPLVAVATAFVAVWHGVVLFFQALSALPIPGVSTFFGTLATNLHASEDRVDGVIADDIVPLLNRLSAIPVPTAPAPAAKA